MTFPDHPELLSAPPFASSLSPAMRRILALLQSRSPLSAKEISQQAFVALKTLEGGGYLKKMKALGLIRVEGWSKNHNGCRRSFKFDHLCALNFDQG